MTTLGFLSVLPALLGVGGFALFMLLRRGRTPPVVQVVINSIAERTKQMPGLDTRLTPRGVLRLMESHPELRQAITPNDLILLQATTRKELIETTLIVVVSAGLVAMSMGLYFFMVHASQTQIQNIAITGFRDGTVTPLNTMDDARVTWNHTGQDGSVTLRLSLVGGDVGAEVTVHAADHEVVIGADRLRSMWPSPELGEKRQLVAVAQTTESTFRSSPVTVETGLNIVACAPPVRS